MNRKLDCYAEKETEDTDHQQAVCAISYTTIATDMHKLFSKLYEQLHCLNILQKSLLSKDVIVQRSQVKITLLRMSKLKLSSTLLSS